MKNFIALAIFFATSFSLAADKKVYKEITDPTKIAIILSILIQDSNEGLNVKTGGEFDLAALALTGFQVVKITFFDTFGNGRICSARLTFNKPNSISNDDQFVSYGQVDGRFKQGTIFGTYCQ